MAWLGDRQYRLGVALLVVGVVCLYVLWQVVWTVFFALTFVYVLHPWREELVERGVHPRAAAAALTTVAFVGVIALFAPVLLVIYQRRKPILDFLRDAPEVVTFAIGEFTFTYELSSLVPVVRDTLSDIAVTVASLAPVLAMKVFLFVFLVYALLYQPRGVRDLVFRAVDDGDVESELLAYHDRIRETLYGLYFVQAATGAATFLIALPVFAILGYGAYFSLAVVAGIFQFIPVIGPSVVVVAVAGFEIAGGDVPQAVLVLVLGLVLVGFLPDAVLRPRLAKFSAGMPASLYFVGFLGGIFTVGPIGIIAGPLALSLLVETFELVADGVEDEEIPAIEGESEDDSAVEGAREDDPTVDKPRAQSGSPSDSPSNVETNENADPSPDGDTTGD